MSESLLVLIIIALSIAFGVSAVVVCWLALIGKAPQWAAAVVLIVTLGLAIAALFYHVHALNLFKNLISPKSTTAVGAE